MSLSAAYIVPVFFHVLGLLLTAWRLYIRFKIRRFWWEDAWAAILLLTGLLWLIAEFIFLLTSGLTSIIAAWIYSIGFTCITTLVRMSILFSIMRIIHGSPRLLKFTYACVAFFVVCWVVLIIEKVVQCASNPSWHHELYMSGKSFCLLQSEISILDFTTDCIADFILVVLPLCMLWRVKLPRRQRRMILSIYASSVLLAFGALFHTIGHILKMVAVMVAGVQVEITLSFFVCNLLVVVTYTYRFLLRDRGGASTEYASTPPMTTSDEDDDDFTTRLTRPAQATSLYLTTIDLDDPTDGQTIETTESV